MRLLRKPKPLRLEDLDVNRTAHNLVMEVYNRAFRDLTQLGLSFRPLEPRPGASPRDILMAVLGQSKLWKVAATCVEWARTGSGKPEEVAVALRELRAHLDGVEVGDAPGREPDLSTAAGLVVVAADTRLTLAEDRTVEAWEVATLASVDERTIRAAVVAGTLQSVGNGRPMRFAADVVRLYLYKRGVPGFPAPLVNPTGAAVDPPRGPV
jgi:hypothetical protein